ncbi:hypothetical protein [Demequina mangrovi]|uniref:hypothetical protein n=1 Tax=Demequina mangrovi TaxID=1043493 RepID=UPI0005AB36D1|nr:hypothetical protein [Demequina mangrovi]
MIDLARFNNEVLSAAHANGNPLDLEHRKVARPWELSPSGLRAHVDGLREAGVTFVASEWGVPDLDALAAMEDVDVVTVVREPVARIVSNFGFDYLRGFTEATSIEEYVDHHCDTHTQTDYYTRMILGAAYRIDGDSAMQVAEVARRLQLVRYVGVLEDPAWISGLSDALNWQAAPVAAKSSNLGAVQRGIRVIRQLGRGRLDLAIRAFGAAPHVGPESREWLAERNATDLRVYSRLASDSTRASDELRSDP